MFCEQCGSSIPDGQSFCSNCGAPAPVAAPAPAPAPAAAPVVAAAPAPAPAPAAQPVQPVYQQPQAQPVQPVYQQVQPVQPVYQQPVYQQAQPVQPVYQQPVYQSPAYQANLGPKKLPNGAATAGLIFGIISLVLVWVPVLNIFSTAILGLLGLIFSIVGLAKKNGAGKPKAVVGLVLTIISIVSTIGYYGLVYQAIISDPSLQQEWNEIWDTAYSPKTSDYDYDYGDLFIDGDFVNTDNGYVTGVLHIDGYRVDF